MFKNAVWIWGSKNCRDDEYFDFKLNFSAAKGGSYALNLSCDSNYMIYKGETLVAFGQYGDYADYKVYDALDLTPFVSSGENEFIITVWHQGKDSQTYIRKPAGLIFTLTCDGNEVLASSPAILSRPAKGFIPYRVRQITSQLGLGFAYDANDMGGEYSKSFEAEGLTKDLHIRPIKKLTVAEPSKAVLTQSGGYSFNEGETDGQLMQYASLSFKSKNTLPLDGSEVIEFTANKGEEGVYLISDIGRETAGMIEIAFEVEEPCDVVIGWGEHLIDGRCRTHIAYRNFSFRYRAKKGKNAFVNPMLRMGGRYIQMFIASPSAKVSTLTMRETAYPLNFKEYKTDNLLRRSIYDTCVNTLIQCMHEHYEDCPWREQALYTMDSRNQMLCGYYAFGETDFPRACLELISHGLREDGMLSLCFPAGLDYPIPMFSLIYFVQMREYLDHSGDLDFIAGKYAFLQKLIDRFIGHRNADGLLPNFTGGTFWNFYEWSDGMSGKIANEDTASIEAPLNAYFSLALQNLAYMAEKLGLAGDSKKYLDMAKSVNAAIARDFYDESAGLFISFSDRRKDEYSVLTNSVCLLCGAADTVNKENIITVLSANGAGGLSYKVIPNTLSMNSFRFDALLNLDRERFAPIILNEIDSVFFDMLKCGATTFWETIEGAGDFGDAGSLCHGWSALPAYYYHVLAE